MSDGFLKLCLTKQNFLIFRCTTVYGTPTMFIDVCMLVGNAGHEFPHLKKGKRVVFYFQRGDCRWL